MRSKPLRARTLAPLFFLAACASPSRPEPQPAALDEAAPAVWRFVRGKYDRDGDGRVQRAEYARSDLGFQRLDADRDGIVSAADFEERWDGVPRVEGRFVYGEGGPEVGEPAPDFALPTTAGATIRLGDFRDQRPVALVFGSFT